MTTAILLRVGLVESCFTAAAFVTIRAGQSPAAPKRRPPNMAYRQCRRRRLFVTTDTLESAIAADAIIGDSVHPVHG